MHSVALKLSKYFALKIDDIRRGRKLPVVETGQRREKDERKEDEKNYQLSNGFQDRRLSV